MTIEERVQLAQTLHNKGYNCAQAVACAFADRVEVDENTLFRMTEAFGLGMGDMQSICGAVSGANLLAGLVNSKGPGAMSKGATYKLARTMNEAFRNKNGSTVCKDLKGVESGRVLRSCPGCIEDMVRIAEQTLFHGESC